MDINDMFIVRWNIAKFRSLLQTQIDETTRQTVQRLLMEFEAVEMKDSSRPVLLPVPMVSART
jgi:hypothetical protein